MLVSRGVACLSLRRRGMLVSRGVTCLSLRRRGMLVSYQKTKCICWIKFCNLCKYFHTLADESLPFCLVLQKHVPHVYLITFYIIYMKSSLRQHLTDHHLGLVTPEY